jgi:DNA-directed RNA polymerase specialized sigma24 family protein
MVPTERSPGAGGRFPTTRWTLILSSQAGSEARRAAVRDLLPHYWKPLYLHARRKGLSADRAEDAVQGFLLQLLQRDFLGALDPARGRFRSYLRTAFDRFLISEHQRASALKRGGGETVVSLDLEAAERSLALSSTPAETAFDHEWAAVVMERALARLHAEFAEGKRRAGGGAVLRFFRLGDGEPPSYAEAAAQCGLSPPQFKAALHRARARFRELVREEVALTVGAEADVDAEMAELIGILTP